MSSLNPHLANLAFMLSLMSIAAIFGLSITSLCTKSLTFFPPPSKQSWQSKVFLVLFRGFLYPLIGLSLFLFLSFETPCHLPRLIVGSGLLLSGLGLAFSITFKMGWRTAFGDNGGLVTTGCFRYSRNPVYVATWAAMIGWAILVPDWKIWGLLLPWASLYLFAPLFEEPWLEAHYGDAYTNYKNTVPRFF